ncbi:putative two-component system sensor histidine kinase/response regulator [Tripterygium wilfordii]|uniref:Putative two-component system sensor histidine kinase/response regulator n=1 Tax=Tripterygium wilfordii TaxID=458696 RepID=A0A7J7CBM3_TRIWF|nr:putative two-component system sensor histidine kinase/response regulator [Tripterygium wilfordii]
MKSAGVCKRRSKGYEKMEIGVGEDTSLSLDVTNKLETHVMVVDDDSTTLALVAAMLKTWKYQVVAVRNPMDALSTLRISHTQFDLVVTDLHMPQMNGIELQRQVEEEFKIPVVIMSSNDEESVILETLEGGAVFYLVKPVTRDDLKNVWQYSVSAKNKGKAAVVVEEIGTNTHNDIIGHGSSSPDDDDDDDEKMSFENSNNRDQGSSSSFANEGKTSGGGTDINRRKNKRKDSNNKGKSKKMNKEDDGDDDDDESRAPKKAKVVWTNSLHNRFLQAIRHIGLDRAVPKKILEFMAMPGLTRENVASHLQKYRLFLKRVAEQGTASCKTLTDRALRSSFATGHPWLMFNNLQQNYPHNLNLQMGRQFQLQFHPGFGFPASLTASSLGLTRHPYNQQGASTSNAVTPRLGYGQSSLLNYNQSHFSTSLFGNRNLVDYQANNRSVLGSNYDDINGTSLPSQRAAGLSNVLLSGTASSSSGHIYQQQNQARPHLYTNTTPLFDFGSDSTPNTTNNNFGGIRGAGDGQLINGQGQIRFDNSTNLSSGLDQGGYGLMNATSNSNNNVNLSPVQTNQIPSTFGNNVGQQASATELPPLPQQQYHELSGNNNGAAGGENFTSNLLINNNISNPPFDNNAQQLGGTGDLSDIFLQPTTEFQIPGTDEVRNPNLGANAYPLEGYTPILKEDMEDDFLDALLDGSAPF